MLWFPGVRTQKRVALSHVKGTRFPSLEIDDTIPQRFPSLEIDDTIPCEFPVRKLTTLLQVPSDFLVRGLTTPSHWFIPRFPRIFHFPRFPRYPRVAQLSRHPRLVHSPRVQPVSLQSRSPRRSSPRGLCCPGPVPVPASPFPCFNRPRVTPCYKPGLH